MGKLTEGVTYIDLFTKEGNLKASFLKAAEKEGKDIICFGSCDADILDKNKQNRYATLDAIPKFRFRKANCLLLCLPWDYLYHKYYNGEDYYPTITQDCKTIIDILYSYSFDLIIVETCDPNSKATREDELTNLLLENCRWETTSREVVIFTGYEHGYKIDKVKISELISLLRLHVNELEYTSPPPGRKKKPKKKYNKEVETNVFRERALKKLIKTAWILDEQPIDGNLANQLKVKLETFYQKCQPQNMYDKMELLTALSIKMRIVDTFETPCLLSRLSLKKNEKLLLEISTSASPQQQDLAIFHAAACTLLFHEEMKTEVIVTDNFLATNLGREKSNAALKLATYLSLPSSPLKIIMERWYNQGHSSLESAIWYLHKRTNVSLHICAVRLLDLI